MNWSEWLMRMDAQFINLMCQRAGVRGKLAEITLSLRKGVYECICPTKESSS